MNPHREKAMAIAKKFRVIGDERYEKAFEEEVFQALLSERKRVIEKLKALDPLDAPGRWEHGTYEEIAEDIHKYLVRKLLEER